MVGDEGRIMARQSSEGGSLRFARLRRWAIRLAIACLVLELVYLIAGNLCIRIGVIENAFNAGWRDHRFPQLSAAEIPELEIEISVLTPPRKVASAKDIEIGVHGVILEKGPYSAVFLPQVAPEQGWGVEETLTHLAMKAGLPPDGWKQGAAFSVFSAEVFGEHEAR